MNHLILDDDTYGINPSAPRMDKVHVCEHSNVSCQTAISCFNICFC